MVICLFNWLKCSEESCAVILAVGLDRVQAPGREGDGAAGSSTWSEASFASLAFQIFKTGMR